ncbi:MAG TPA: DUF2334 domain-containing protein, partial [Anaerolineae bacterium]|nr:DUF2334 domain-containing protein [Anaerolineae bacterium]
MANPVALAARAKGPFALLKRTCVIIKRYGLTPARLDQALARFIQVLKRFDCGATFPVTAIAVERHPALWGKYQAQGIEFAVHGYQHKDYTRLPLQKQLEHLAYARDILSKNGIHHEGFRCPYLRWSSDTLTAIRQQGFAYDSSQALAWDVVDGQGTSAYRRALAFYGAQAAIVYPALPRLENGLLRIPYSIPDDEALVDRLQLTSTAEIGEIWLTILRRSYELGELFTLGLHPERIARCEAPLITTLTEARALSPPVWIARLNEIAAWWRGRTAATVEVTEVGGDTLRLTVAGPPGTTILGRSVDIVEPTTPWAGDYRQVVTASCTIRSAVRPFVGISPACPSALSLFLRQQGYIVEISDDGRAYS